MRAFFARANPPLALLGILWLVSAVVGLGVLTDYANTPGAAGEAPVAWPPSSGIERSRQLPTLLLLAHPRCPCTRATIGELAVLMAHAQGRLAARVVFFKPTDGPEGWEKTDLWESAAAIPGVEVVADPGGREAARVGGLTSGQTLVYDAGGRLRFQGGITAARGHAGDNAGRSAILALLDPVRLHRGVASRSQTFVFGCALRSHRAAAPARN
jgi:hypothetical protein